MADHNELGRAGERAAMVFLENLGYTLRDCNWRDGHLEIDIVAEWYGEIIFVEVKTRTNENFAPAIEAVNLQKKRNIIAAGRNYMARNGLYGFPYTFDIITVVGAAPPFEITHVKDAYREREVWEKTHHRRAPFEV